MKILNGVSCYEVYETNFEAARLALNYMGENYAAPYFHGIAGSAFRIGGICPCAPTCTLAMSPQQLLNLLGYDYDEYPYDDADKSAAHEKMLAAVRASIDGGAPALVWNAFTECEWDIVAGYDESEKAFYGRGAYPFYAGDYGKNPWDKTLHAGASTGIMAIVIKKGGGAFIKKDAEAAALREAVRHANDAENADKVGGGEWVFLQGKAAYKRWADDFSNPEHKRGLGDAYCMDVYSSCHALAGLFLRGIAPDYPDAAWMLSEAADIFDLEAECLESLRPLLGWSSPESDAERNLKASALIKKAVGHYGSAIDILSDAIEYMYYSKIYFAE